jgi:hypothetical protein
MDSEYDHCPREQALRTAADLLEAGEQSIASECASLLLSLLDPLELAPGVSFYCSRRYFDRARAKALTLRAARAAMAVLLEDEGMDLPLYIETAYNMPNLPEPAPGARNVRSLP